MSKKWVFIVGPSRSGTSAFGRLLGRHGQVVMGLERYKNVRPLTQNMFEKEAFFDFESAPDQGHRAHYRIQGEKFDHASWFGDKIPSLIHSLDTLHDEFPGCTVFYMLRRPEQVANSFAMKGADATKGFWHGKTFEKGLSAWHSAIIDLQKNIDNTKINLRIVDYNKVFPYSPDDLNAVLAELDLEMDEAITGYYNETRSKSESITSRPLELTDEQKAEMEKLGVEELYAWAKEHATRPK